MRSGIVFVQGKKVNLDTAETLYSDGSFRGSRGVTLFRTKKGNLVWLAWTNWQGEDDEYKFVSPQEAKEKLGNHAHPHRVADAIQQLGIPVEEA